MPKQSINDASLLAAALEGLELQRARIDAQIREVKSMLGGKAAAPAAGAAAAKPRKKRKKLSAAARARIAAAQKKRWAEYHKKAKAGS